MQFKLQHADSQTDDPHDVIVAQLRDLAPRLAHDPSEIGVTPAASLEPASEPSLRAAPLNDNSGDIRNLTPRARSGRGVMLLIVCAGIAATVAWHSYGEEAKQRLSHLVPQLFPGAPAPTQSANAADPQSAAPQPATDPAPAQEAAAAPATPTQPATAPAAAEASSTQTTLPPEAAQSIETMAREIASLKQTVEQLQAGQQQLGRDVAKVTEHEARRKLTAQAAKPTPPPRPQRALTPGAPPRTLGTLAPYSPPPATSQGQTYPQGAAQRDAYIPPPAPTQLPPQPGDTSAPRPPMPLR
ncbi:MAG: hypothetical protein ACRC9K_07430 [Afipia sp.]